MLFRSILFIYLISLASIGFADHVNVLSSYGSVFNDDIDREYKNIPLHQAVKKKQLKEVQRLLKEGANVNARDGYGNTALVYFIMGRGYSCEHKGVGGCGYYDYRDKFLKLLHTLLDAGADINARNKFGRTPLWYCHGPNRPGSDWSYGFLVGEAGHYDKGYSPCADMIKIFVKRSEYSFKIENDKDRKLRDWMLGVLTGIGDLETFKFLVNKKGFKISKDILSYTTSETSLKFINYLLDKIQGINIDAKSYYYRRGQWTVLSSLVSTTQHPDSLLRSNALEIIKVLLNNGADVNAKNRKGETPILSTVTWRGCSPKTAEILIQKGADLSEKKVLLAKAKKRRTNMENSAKREKKSKSKKQQYLAQSKKCNEMVKLLESIQKKS